MGRGLAGGDRFQVDSFLLRALCDGQSPCLIASCQHLWEKAGGLEAAGRVPNQYLCGLSSCRGSGLAVLVLFFPWITSGGLLLLSFDL